MSRVVVRAYKRRSPMPASLRPAELLELLAGRPYWDQFDTAEDAAPPWGAPLDARATPAKALVHVRVERPGEPAIDLVEWRWHPTVAFAPPADTEGPYLVVDVEADRARPRPDTSGLPPRLEYRFACAAGTVKVALAMHDHPARLCKDDRTGEYYPYRIASATLEPAKRAARRAAKRAARRAAKRDT